MNISYLEGVLLGEERGLLSWLIRLIMLPGAMLYSVILKGYLACYALGIRKRCRLVCPVVSVGNVTFGGTGKTPAVIEVCKLFIERGKRVAVLSRGHGGRVRGTLTVSDGRQILATSDEAGDEPLVLAKALPGVPVIVDKDRRRSGRMACADFRPDVIILDDGLQYWQLYRGLDIVVMDSRKPLGSGFVVPMGDLREPASGLRRAGLILLNGASGLSRFEREALVARLSARAGGARVLGCRREPVGVRRFDGSKCHQVDWLRGRRVVGFCGIGRPGSFAEALESVGAAVMELMVFPDHRRYSASDFEQIVSSKAARKAELVVTTAKDAARLQVAPIDDLYVLDIELEIEDRKWLGQYLSDWLDAENSTSRVQKTSD